MRITSRFIDSRVNAEPIACASGEEFCLFTFKDFLEQRFSPFLYRMRPLKLGRKALNTQYIWYRRFSDILCKLHLSSSIRYLTENLSCLLIFNLQWWLCQVGREPITIILNVHIFRKWYLYQILSGTSHIIEWSKILLLASYLDAGKDIILY